jgi:hypothetical protein
MSSSIVMLFALSHSNTVGWVRGREGASGQSGRQGSSVVQLTIRA